MPKQSKIPGGSLDPLGFFCLIKRQFTHLHKSRRTEALQRASLRLKVRPVYEFVILTVFPFAVIYAASMDLLSMTIPNRINLFLVYAFLALAPFANLSLEQFAWHIAAAVVVFIPTFALFALRILGGGDVKLVSAIALWIGWSELHIYLVAASICGGVLTIALLAFRSLPLPLLLAQQRWILNLHKPAGDLPYGIALAAGALLVYPYTIWFSRIVA
jgi:prepilin peptidase CpaA